LRPIKVTRIVPEGVLLRVTIAALLALTLATGAAAAQHVRTAAPVTWRATSSPFRLSVLVGGTARVSETTLSGGPGGRLSYRLADGTFHGLTNLISTGRTRNGMTYQVATDEPDRTATVAVQRSAGGVSVALTLRPATGVVDTFEAFASQPDEHFLGGGERPSALDLRGQSFAIKAAYACSNTMPTPFFLGSTGYGILLKTSTIAAMAFPGATLTDSCAGGAEARCPLGQMLPVAQLCVKSAGLRYQVFIGSPTQVVSAYARMVGRPQLPPVSQFALIKWRDVAAGPADLYEDVDKLHALKIPIGWVMLDNPWETGGCYGTMTFDPQKFPDPAGMIAALHARGVKFMLWISPLLRQQFCPPSTQYSQLALFGAGNAATIDLTDPATLATFRRKLDSLIALGIDGFKADRGDEIDLEPFRLAGGSGLTLHNEYPLLYARAVAAAVNAAGKSGSFATLFRAGSPGSAAVVPGFWGGDQPGTFLGLAEAIHDGLSAGVAGYSIWGSDTGGYDSAGLTPEVFVRWAQFSAVTPIFEVGGIGENATPWNFGTNTVAAFRQAAVLHYELFPYLYALAAAAHANGVPVLRPLALEYPSDPLAWTHDLEVMIGNNLLAVPVIVPSVAGTTSAPVYLPAGAWLDLASGVIRVGNGRPFTRATDITELPLYMRAGAAIPFAARTPLLWPKAWPTDALAVPGRGGWIYAPGRGSATATAMGYGSFKAVAHAATVDLTIRDAPAQTQVLVAGANAPVAVRIDGRDVPRAGSIAALRRAIRGWAITRTPFPGVVLKLPPRSGVAQARIILAHTP